MADGSYTETSSEGWLSRLGNAVQGGSAQMMNKNDDLRKKTEPYSRQQSCRTGLE